MIHRINRFLEVLFALTCSTSEITDQHANATAVMRVHRINILGVNVFLIETNDALYLIDTGYPGFHNVILRKIASLKKELRIILLTHSHYDHFGNVALIKEKTNAPVAIHRLDAPDLHMGKTALGSVSIVGTIGKLLLPVAEKFFPPHVACADILLEDGDHLNNFGFDAKVIHTPGHTRGSCTFIIQDSIAFTGDLIVNFPFFSKQCFFANSWSDIDSSIIKLLKHPFSIFYTGHRGKIGTRKTVENIAKKISAHHTPSLT
jgi:glyoxylase-like metal-dependent hydrolase (beta-lactamase superfamily II)